MIIKRVIEASIFLRDGNQFMVEVFIDENTKPVLAGGDYDSMFEKYEYLCLSGVFIDGRFQILKWDVDWNSSDLIEPTLSLCKIIIRHGVYTGDYL